jgi:cholest-4-en-3-one 26-monooxygenase
MRQSLDGIDLWNPDNYLDGPPHAMFTRLRNEAPVYWHEEPDGPGFWVISKYTDVQALSRDWETYSSERGGTEITDYPPQELELLRLLPLYMDPPKHTRYRALVNKAFTPRTVKTLARKIDETCADIVGEVAEEGGCEFVTEVAEKLPLAVIADMIGIPVGDRRLVADWCNRIVGWMDPELALDRSDATLASMEMLEYASGLARYKRRNGADDLATGLVNAEIEHDGVRVRLEESEIGLFFLLLTIAGNETTRNMIALAMQAFTEHPDQWELLRANPGLMDIAVEEMLRWGTPTMHFRRTAMRDRTVRGELIAEGEKVTLWYISANRDEEVFARPHEFDIRRRPNDHLSFGGGGPHYCFGSHLARLEIATLYRRLADEMRRPRLIGQVRRLRSNFANSIKEMRIEFDVATPRSGHRPVTAQRGLISS